MHQAALGKEEVSRVASAILRDRVIGVLPGVGILQFDGGDRQSVDEQCHIDGFERVPLAEMQLPRDGKHIRVVFGERIFGERMAGPEVCEVDQDAAITDPLAQDIEHAARVDLGGETLCELSLRSGLVVAVVTDELVPVLDLRGADEPEQFAGVDAEIDVVGALCAHPALLNQLELYALLECVLT
ncbi:Uncharacterised protein [Mycobacteroides abscessus subsp. abscessus]|nr:Uncharacterised protein [Mycobacteroides abscessus subsp. abscessus]